MTAAVVAAGAVVAGPMAVAVADAEAAGPMAVAAAAGAAVEAEEAEEAEEAGRGNRATDAYSSRVLSSGAGGGFFPGIRSTSNMRSHSPLASSGLLGRGALGGSSG